ncbi:MFS general substrate transporter [Aspergillus sclerotioniger CBS 115572]|uniref:MFS general substrate transporter n=1 Tax=Aspergillus sclerotioniger CBS 115572 TaxID=1450535 RepID=A0A317UYI8_9EURO|nr:MFS general substrate transporter [Aspergillus sclerotioniger CBS 115572]PWY67123.1 MFS general substrate transporter [Aspergillus sclerotioniger CBS 115572]
MDTSGINTKAGAIDSINSIDEHPIEDIRPEDERALVWRLDCFFLVVGFLGYAFKYLDQTNISNAYVSGMEDDLKLYGNEYNYFTTFFNIGYMVMLYPSCIIISHVGPSVWLPTCEVLWGILTCCLSTVTSAKQVYGLRFLIGFFEGATWPGYFTIISQWYLPHEMALRMSLYNMAQPVGAMLSGAMQGALSTNLDGAMGRSGWRWAFIINGVCTIFIALMAFVALPGFPESQNPLSKIYLKPRHIMNVLISTETATARTKRVGRKPQSGIRVGSFLRCFKFWHLWLFAIAWAIGTGTTPTSYFNLWLKSLKNPDGTKKYSVAMLDYLPIIGQAIQLVAEILFSGFSDYFGVRLPFLLLHSAINITSLIILVIQPSNEHAYMAGWYMDYIGAVSTMLLCAWAAAHLEKEPEVRTVLFATGTLFSYLFSAFLPIAAYPASEAPHWRIGAKLYLGLSSLATVLFVCIHFAFKWEERRKGKRRVGVSGVG